MEASNVSKVRVYGMSVLKAETVEELLLALKNTGPHMKKGEVINFTQKEQEVMDKCLKMAA